ncbi:MAG: diguanylate cyclase [Pseudoxanthomonas sp.]
MTRRAGRLPALLLALSQALPAGAQARSDAASAREFDALYARITGPAALDGTDAANDANLERLRTLLPPDDAARDARFRSVYCYSSNSWGGDYAHGLAYTDEALRRARAANDQEALARAMICRIAYVLPLQGSKQALAEADKAVALAEKAQAPQLLGEILMYRGSLFSQMGDQAKALLDYQRARTAFRDAGIDHEIDRLLIRLAVAYRRIGDWAHAELYLNQSLARMEEKKDWTWVATTLTQLGYLHDEAGAPDKAQAAFQRAIAVATEHGSGSGASSARLGLASVQVGQGRYDDALAALAQARADYAKAGDTQNDDMLLLLTGRALAGKGRHREALPLYRQALPLLQRDGNERYLATLHQALAASEEALGRDAEALADFKRYSELQSTLQRKMQLEQNRLLAYEHEARTRELENHRLRTEADAQRQQLAALERVRGWQRLALLLGTLLIALLTLLAVRQQRLSRRLRTLAMTDPLTGAASRVAIVKTADNALAQAARNGAPLSVLMIDLDHFKAINDRYGHAAGDAVLHAVAAAWQAQLREYDALGRTGGEEFVVVCADASLALARSIAERLLHATRDVRLPGIDPDLRIGTSIGVAEAQAGDTCESLFARADAALYRAKSLGRDRVESWNASSADSAANG